MGNIMHSFLSPPKVTQSHQGQYTSTKTDFFFEIKNLLNLWSRMAIFDFCIVYQKFVAFGRAVTNYSTAPSDAERREFVTFFYITKKLYNYHSRVTYEGLMITLHNPDLNKLVFHKSMTFVCECANFKIENTVGT